MRILPLAIGSSLWTTATGLGLDRGLSDSTDTIWMLSSGNQRAVIELYEYRWNTSKWIEDAVLPRLRTAMEGIDRGKLIAFVEDPDNDSDIAKLLENRNLMIWMETALLNTMLSPDPELSIGEGMDLADISV